MFNQSQDDRLSSWVQLRKEAEVSENPLKIVAEFWSAAPFVPYNKDIDPFNQFAWPTPWEIIVNNKYDDFTKALMIAWTLKLTDKFKKSQIEIKMFTDTATDKGLTYNLVIIDDVWVLNYQDNEVFEVKNLPESFRLENLIQVDRPR